MAVVVLAAAGFRPRTTTLWSTVHLMKRNRVTTWINRLLERAAGVGGDVYCSRPPLRETDMIPIS